MAMRKQSVLQIVLTCILPVLLLISCKDNTVDPGPFSGITETGITGPEPTGNVDPDDWRPIFDCASPDTGEIDIPPCTRAYPAYPNPSVGTCMFTFGLATPDSVVITLNDQPTHVAKTILARTLAAGMYAVHIDFAGLNPGIYRLYFCIIRPPDTFSTYGDIQVNG
jgi:hypothetical protein